MYLIYKLVDHVYYGTDDEVTLICYIGLASWACTFHPSPALSFSDGASLSSNATCYRIWRFLLCHQATPL